MGEKTEPLRYRAFLRVTYMFGLGGVLFSYNKVIPNTVRQNILYLLFTNLTIVRIWIVWSLELQYL
jgi:hypothetical protein